MAKAKVATIWIVPGDLSRGGATTDIIDVTVYIEIIDRRSRIEFQEGTREERKTRALEGAIPGHRPSASLLDIQRGYRILFFSLFLFAPSP